MGDGTLCHRMDDGGLSQPVMVLSVAVFNMGKEDKYFVMVGIM